MKFVLNDQDKKHFQETAEQLPPSKVLALDGHKKWTPRLWELFWEQVENTDYQHNTDLQYEAGEFFENMYSLSPTLLSHTDFLEQMCDLFVEHRTDVSEMISDQLNGSLLNSWKINREHRFAHFEIPARYSRSGEPIPCMYDTLTTQLEVDMPDPADPSEEYIILDGVKYCD